MVAGHDTSTPDQDAAVEGSSSAQSDSGRSSVSGCTDYDVLYKKTYLWKVKDVNRMYRRTYWVDRENKNLCFGDSKKPFWVPTKTEIPLERIVKVQKGRRSVKWRKISYQVSEEEERSGRKLEDINDNSKCFSIHYKGRNNESEVIELVVPSNRLKHWPDALGSLVEEMKPRSMHGIHTSFSSEKLTNTDYKAGDKKLSVQLPPSQKQKLSLRSDSRGTNSNISMSISSSESAMSDSDEELLKSDSEGESGFLSTKSDVDPASPMELKPSRQQQLNENHEPNANVENTQATVKEKNPNTLEQLQESKEDVLVPELGRLQNPNAIPQYAIHKKAKEPTVCQVVIEKHEQHTRGCLAPKEVKEKMTQQSQIIQIVDPEEKQNSAALQNGFQSNNNLQEGEISKCMNATIVSMDQKETENEVIVVINEKVDK